LTLRVNIQADVKHAAAFFKELDQVHVNRASSNALNVVIREVRNESLDEISKVRRVKKSLVRRAVRITQRASNSVLTAICAAVGRPISLKEYSAKQNELGVTVNVEGTPKLIKGAFGPGYRGTGRGQSRVPGQVERLGGHVFVRTTQARLPIKKLMGPSITTGFIKDVVRRAQRRLIAVRWPIVLREKMSDQLVKLRAKHGGR